MLCKLLLWVFNFEFFKELNYVVIRASVSLVPFFLRFHFHELFVDIVGNNSCIDPIDYSHLIVLLSGDDFISDCFVSKIITKNVLKLVSSD